MTNTCVCNCNPSWGKSISVPQKRLLRGPFPISCLLAQSRTTPDLLSVTVDEICLFKSLIETRSCRIPRGLSVLGSFLSVRWLCRSATVVTQLSSSEFFYCKVVTPCTGTPTHLLLHLWMDKGFPGGASGKEPACQCRRHRRCRFHLWIQKIPWRRAWQPTPVFLPGESHGQRSVAGYSPQGRRELDTTERAFMDGQLGCVHFEAAVNRTVLKTSG